MNPGDLEMSGRRAAAQPLRPATTVSVDLLDESDPGALATFDHRGEPFGVFMALECETGKVYCIQRPENAGWSGRVERELVIMWRIPLLTSSDANALMTSLVGRFKQIIDGFTVVAGTRSNNSYGVFTDGAKDAIGFVEAMCAPSNWGPSEVIGWQRALDLVKAEGEGFVDRVGLSAHSLDRELEPIALTEADRVMAASGHRHFILVDMHSVLLEIRNSLRGDLVDTLWELQKQIGELTDRRDGVFRQLAACGMSSRSLEAAVRGQMKHRTIQDRMPRPEILRQAHALLQKDAGWHNDAARLVYWGNTADLRLVLVGDDPEVHYLQNADKDGTEVPVPLGIVVPSPRIVLADPATGLRTR